MNKKQIALFSKFIMAALFLGCGSHHQNSAATVPPPPVVPSITIHIDTDSVAAKVSPTLYGLMTEEINFSYDGGLYGELIRNRVFADGSDKPLHWSPLRYGDHDTSISLDKTQPLNDALPTSLKVEAPTLPAGQRAGIANDGYWGVPVRSNTTYRASFYARGDDNFKGPITAAIESIDEKNVAAQAEIPAISSEWKQYTVELKTNNVAPSSSNRFVLSTSTSGTVWFNLVSLFPPTFNDRPNGNRIDIMQKLVDMKPTFLRFPGGNYLEGDDLPNRFDFKKTIGDVSKRPGHRSPWKYRSTDGMGLLEFLEWCEDIHGQPVLAVFAGYTLNRQSVKPADLGPYVQDALDEIEYVIGDATTKWGAQRSADGHPAPFKLTYVEVGNEDNLDRSGSYRDRFPPFFDAIKAKYPQIQVIATAMVQNRPADVIDEHSYYRTAADPERQAHRFDNRSRTDGPKVFMGEWATRIGSPTTNFAAALGDAAFMTGLERNSDIVMMSCYAPLLVNVNPGGMQWQSNLIGYDALNSYGSPSYYAQKMFSNYLGDVVCQSSIAGVPTTMPATAPAATTRRARAGGNAPRGPIEQFFYVVTKDSKSGTIYLKVVNVSANPLAVQINLTGAGVIANSAECIQLHAENPNDTNSITEPTKVVPVESKINGVSNTFIRTFPASSITVLVLHRG